MSEEFLLGFDMGTSGLKAVAYSLGTVRRYSVYEEWKLQNPRPGFAEFDCEELWGHIVSCIRRLRDEKEVSLERILGIGFSALCPGVIALDETGKEISPCIIFMDSRSEEEAIQINREFPIEESYPILGNRIAAGATSATTIMWIKNHQPETYRMTDKFVHMPTWAGARLTQKIRMDYSNAAGTALYDIHNQCWSSAVIDRMHLDFEKLPELTDAVKMLGGVVNEEVIRLGIRKGTPVSCGAGDTVSALFALGIRQGEAMLSLGTSHALYTISPKDQFDSRLMARSYVKKGMWAVGGAMSNPGGMLRWFRDDFCKDLAEAAREKNANVYDLIAEEAAAVPPGAGGLLCLPYINGERSPVFDPRARAAFVGVGYYTNRGSIARAIMEGAACGIRQLLEVLELCLERPIVKIHITGGGSRGAFLVQTISNVTGRNLHVREVPDAGAVGAALIAGLAAGAIDSEEPFLPRDKELVYSPDLSQKDCYEKLYQRYIRLYPALHELFE